MNRLIILGIFILIFLIGLVKLLHTKIKLTEQSRFAEEFLNKFREYLSSSGKDTKTYGWLIHRSSKAQSEMGTVAVLKIYRPPYQNFAIKNYQIILDMISDLRYAFENMTFNSKMVSLYGDTIQEAIIRYLGILDDKYNDHMKSLKNPIIWFREGIQTIVIFPITLLHWFGLFNKSTLNSLSDNFIFKAFSVLIAFIEFFGSIISIILGWEEFLKLIKSLLHIGA
ncbi:MAG: hypothetical protein U9R23_04425 [Candidatus Cloacimonadota bacterium]|nr:hypothetical protein [Candidatus Cloacimonadota bacterium]